MKVCETSLWNESNSVNLGTCGKRASWRIALLAEGDRETYATCDDHIVDNLDFTQMNVVWLEDRR